VLPALAALLLVGVAFVLWQFDRPPFDLRLLEQLRVGMQREEVVSSVLGARAAFTPAPAPDGKNATRSPSMGCPRSGEE
jgi:hypothetical protein